MSTKVEVNPIIPIVLILIFAFLIFSGGSKATATCGTCNGSGTVIIECANCKDWWHWDSCPVCKDKYKVQKRCGSCLGTGKVIKLQ